MTTEAERRPSARARYAFATFAGLAAVLVALGVFVGLPARWAPVDVPAMVVIVAEAATAVALIRWRPWSARLVRGSSAFALAVGLVTVALLAWTAAYLYGVYGPIGKGGALIYLFVLALVLPYLVGLPAGRLLWIGPTKRP